MATKQVLLRVDEHVHARLKARSAIEGRSINEIAGEAIREYSERHPVSREAMIRMARAIAREDADLLDAIGDA